VIGGDRVRIFYVCEALSKRFDLTLLSICQSAAEMHAPIPSDGIFKQIERFYLPKWHSWVNCLLALYSSTPLQVAYYKSSLFQRRVDELLCSHSGVLAHLIRTGHFIDHGKAPRFLEMTDAISLNYGRIKRTSGLSFDLRLIVFKLEALRLKAYEQRVVNDFDASFIVSEADRQHLFGPSSDTRVVVCSNGVDLDKFPFRFYPEGEDVIFIGNMTSLQNLDAARYMAVKIFPLVRFRCPGIKLRLVGRIQPKKAQELSRIPGVIVTGEVPDVAMAVKGGAVGVCPLRLGAGIQNKVLEYMALGLPTVTTSMGLEGLSAQPGRDLIVADGSGVFADAVTTLVVNRAEAKTIAVNGRHYVQSGHSWGVLLEPLVSIIAKRVIGT